MISYKEYIDFWYKNNKRHIGLISYRKVWKNNGNKPIYCIRTNGAKKKNGDTCFDFFIHIGYLVFNYTNFDLQGSKKQLVR